MKIRPINGRVVVKPVKSAGEIKGGIIIPDTAQEKPWEAEVVAIADDATEEVAVGDSVIYAQHSGAEVKIDDDILVVLTTEDLIAKYKDVDKIPE